MNHGLAALLMWTSTSFCCLLAGTEYFVAVGGDDSTAGTSREAAFATIQRGVDALQPGDTLTILPGEYFGSVQRDGIGGPDAETVIRAAIPGTVILRGDVPAPEFRRVDGFRFVYVADFKTDGEVRAVNEWDTLSILSDTLNYQGLEFVPGQFYHDADAGKLYISTPDLIPPDGRKYTVSVNDSHGIFLRNAERVVIEGIGVTGFNTNRQLAPGYGTLGAVWGVFLRDAKNSVVRDCKAWMNGQGIGLASIAEGAGDNVITHCTAWANSSRYGTGDRGGFSIHGDRVGRRDVIQHCTAFMNAHGVNIYLVSNTQEQDVETRNRMVNNLAWGNWGVDFEIKTGYPNQHTVEYCAGPGRWSGVHDGRVTNSLIGDPRSSYSADNIVLDDELGIDWNLQFADPANHDYRLQSDSVLRGTGPDGTDPGPFPYEGNVYFVSAVGNDAAEGRSVQTAWRTVSHALRSISAGDTLYLEPGDYEISGTFALAGSDAAPITVRSRGEGEARLAGNIALAGTAIEFERVQFLGSVSVANASDFRFHSCRFLASAGPGLQLSDSSAIAVVHCQFAGFRDAGILAKGTEAIFVQGNIFANTRYPALSLTADSSILYRDYNAYADGDRVLELDGKVHGLARARPGEDYYSTAASGPSTAAISAAGWQTGPYRPHQPEAELPKVTRPELHSVTPHSANLEWWSSAPIEYTLIWGPAADPARYSEPVLAHRFATYSLIDLKPDTEYRVKLEPDAPFTVFGEAEATQGSLEYSFRTPADYPRDATTFYVSPAGDDAADGLTPATAWKSVASAAARLYPGDTLLLLSGTYPETVRLRASGEPGRPITIAAAPGEKVVFDGVDRTLNEAIILSAKSHVHLDGLYFVGYSNGSRLLPWGDRISRNGVINIYAGGHNLITRCFVDGRGQGTSPGLVQAMFTNGLLVENSVALSHMGGAVGVTASPDTRVRNCVFLRIFISVFSEIMNEPDQPFIVENSIITDNLAVKQHASLYFIGMAEALQENNNCYFFRPPAEQKNLFTFYGAEAYERAAAAYGGMTAGFENRMFADLETITLKEYQQRVNPDSTSFIADPLFVGSREMDPLGPNGEPIFIPDRMVGTLRNLDFPDLFATNPIVMARDIGLQPTAFADFHFTR